MVGLALVVFSWCFDAAVEFLVFKEDSFLNLIFVPSLYNLWGRLLTICLLIIFIIYVNKIARSRDRLAAEFHKTMLTAQGEKARTDSIIAAIGDGVSIQDTDFKILYQNDAHKELLGGDFVGEYCYKAYSCRDQVCPECPLAICFRNGITHKMQRSVTIRDNTKYMEVTASPLRDESGKIIAGIELLRDISQSRQAEERLRNSELRFRNLVESTSDWVWEIDENGVYTYVSPQIRNLLGYVPEEVIGKTPFDLMPRDEAQRVAEIFRSIAAEYKPLHALENSNLHKDGRTVVLETSGVPIFDNDGVFRGYRGIDRDITERKQAETEIRALNENLAHRAAQLAIANKELEAFSSSVSHDLRTPLTRIYSAGQIMMDSYTDNLGEHGLFFVQTICDACENMEELIEALLSLSRMASSELNRSEYDISYIAEIVAAELQLSDPSRHAEFAIERGLVDYFDPRLIKALLENLFGNAWKYTQKTPETRIEFGVTEVEGEKVYFVRDNGAGFDMEKAHKLFKPFQRLHDNAEFKGTGIGLATVRRIVERHGGRVWGEGEIGRGATFYFTLK